jgi:hypothetical protein
MNIEESSQQELAPNTLPPDEVNAIFTRLRALKAECLRHTKNKHDLAIILISACIEEGFTRGNRITGTLKHLGLNRQHAGKTLADGTGDDPDRHYWRKDSAGHYWLHN